MFFYDGYSCPVCDAPFTESDDIVACPVCGAPHHRACWQQEGHCHLEDKHGTDEQWSRETAQPVPPAEEETDAPPVRVCPNCGHHNPEFAEFCAHCGRSIAPEEAPTYTPPVPPQTPYGEYAPYRHFTTPWDAENPDEQIEECSARDMAAAVVSNTSYYMPRFRRMAAEGRVSSWNWAAFLFTYQWLFFRKQYLAGSLYLLLEMMIAGVTNFLYLTMFGGAGASYAELAEQMADQMMSGALSGPMLALTLLSFVTVASHLFLGFFGNRLYLSTCVRRVRSFREDRPDGDPTELAMRGGTALSLALISYLLVEMVLYFVFLFLM